MKYIFLLLFSIAGLAGALFAAPVFAQVPLNLFVTVNGFERKVQVFTDDAGQFGYSFRPQGAESGLYKVCAVHPDLLDRPVQATFAISRVSASPTAVTPRTYPPACRWRPSWSANE